MTNTTPEWIERAIAAGADRLAIHADFCPDPVSALKSIAAQGVMPVLVLPLKTVIDESSLPWGLFQRVLLMGTEIGIKGVGLDPRVPERIRTLLDFKHKLGVEFEIFVDGGIRKETVPLLASAGADGVVPGSLVLKEAAPRAAIAWIHSLGPQKPTAKEIAL
jgi:ribulose-phosphate 3-epimerase